MTDADALREAMARAIEAAYTKRLRRIVRDGPHGQPPESVECGADSWGNVGPSGQKWGARLPAYTASLDSALALVERCLPSGTDGTRSVARDQFGWTKSFAQCFDWQWKACVYRVADGYSAEARAPTPALALLAAMLKAMEEKQ